uniref:Uncharacterized protein n=1 Tax=Pratia angulata TaxID=85225 RepID=A0A1Z2QV08_9ASTR|nr:hypothetical protein Lo_ang1Pt0118 [Pratia angulata]ASA35313.1 hypothetical protein Lo_ang1Pt0118 [Pratia angulata]
MTKSENNKKFDCLHDCCNPCISPKKNFENEKNFEKYQARTCSYLPCPKGSDKKAKINGKRFPEFERESLFPERTELKRKSLSFGKEHQPALTCPHRQKCRGYKHSFNTGHCATYLKETCKIFWEAFHSGHAAGERWMNQRIHRVAITRMAWEANLKARLTAAAENPKTELDSWHLGFWHGAFLRLKRIHPED